MMRERMAFGPELRRARERRGLSLEQIADWTKVAASLYAGLERNDLSRWPSGLFRRAFVRAYAETVGLDAEEVCRRFVQLFPEEGAAPQPAAGAPPAPAAPEPAEQPRLMLAVPAQPARATVSVWRRAAAAALDVALAVVPAVIVSLLAGSGWFWIVTGAIGVTGHVLVFAVHGATPGGWLLLESRAAGPGRPDAASSGRRQETARNAGPRRPVSRQTRAVGGRRFPR